MNKTTFKQARTMWATTTAASSKPVLDGLPIDMLFCPLCEKHIENLLQHLKEAHE